MPYAADFAAIPQQDDGRDFNSGIKQVTNVAPHPPSLHFEGHATRQDEPECRQTGEGHILAHSLSLARERQPQHRNRQHSIGPNREWTESRWDLQGGGHQPPPTNVTISTSS